MHDNYLIAWALSPLGPILNAVNPAARLFLLNVLTGLIIAGVLYWKAGKLAEYRSAILSREVWLSRSAVNDYFVLVVNPWFLFPLIMLSQSEVRDFFLDVPLLLQYLGVGPNLTHDKLLPAATIALTVCLFISDDFIRWGVHYMSHRIPLLWEFHKVHHSAEVLNFVTAERSHPIDVYLTNIALVASAALVNGIFVFLLGDHLTWSSIAGANIITVGFNLAGSVLRHSPFWISYGPTVERWLISPAMHQIHHSSLPAHWDRNFGSFLALWDRLAGTQYVPKEQESITFGIGKETVQYRSLTNLYILPIKKLLLSVQRTDHPTAADPVVDPVER